MNFSGKIISLLYESPDNIKFKDKRIIYQDKDAHAFIYYDVPKDANGGLWFSDQAGWGHSLFLTWISEKYKVTLPSSSNDGKRPIYFGRLWKDSKVISFWEYPKKPIFDKLMVELKKHVKIDDTWQIDLFNKEHKPLLIPVDKYSGNEMFDVDGDLRKERELHSMSPVEKQKALKNQGVLPGYTKIKLPANMTFAQYNSLLKQESVDFLIEKKSEMEVLKKNKVDLTKEERQKAMNAKCVWHFGNHDKPSCAIWSGKDSSGKQWYCSNTHRAWSKKPTLDAAIKAFEFIKSTS